MSFPRSANQGFVPPQGAPPPSLIMPLINASPVDIGPRKRRRLNPEAQEFSMNAATPLNYRIPGSNAAGTSWGSTTAQNKATEIGGDTTLQIGEQKMDDNVDGSSQVRRNSVS